jgi:hypothetical protein
LNTQKRIDAAVRAARAVTIDGSETADGAHEVRLGPRPRLLPAVGEPPCSIWT